MGGWVISGHQEFFFLATWWVGYFFHSSAIIFFYYICAAWNFFSSDKRLQEIFFQNQSLNCCVNVVDVDTSITQHENIKFAQNFLYSTEWFHQQTNLRQI